MDMNMTIGRNLDPALKGCVRSLLAALQEEIECDWLECDFYLWQAFAWFDACPY